MRMRLGSLATCLLFTVLLFSLGKALAADVPSATDTNNTLGATVSSNSPIITSFDIKNGTGGTATTRMQGQLDVSTTYFFWVTVEDQNGWADLRWINIRIWFDGDSSEIAYSAQSTGANYRIDLNYTNAAPLTDPALTEWSVAEGNMVYTSGSSTMTTETANQKYTFKLAFSLNAQVRQANDPINSGVANYDDLGSWNAEVRAKDTDNADVINRVSATGVYHEFGVFQYTSVSIGANWDAGTIAPGASGTTSAVTVTHQSNRAYRMKVWFDSVLTSGGNTIAITNVEILAAGDGSDAISSDTAFTALNEADSIYIHGSSSTTRAHDTSGNSQTTGVQFRVNVPLATPSGSYVATLTIKVEQP